MARSRRERADEIFVQALEVPPEERTTLVARACDGDDRLREEVQSLLGAADDMDQNFLETPLLPVHESSPLSGLDTGDRVGPYRLAEELGRGGMGRVFKAVRDDAQFDQEVALKVLKRGLDTDEIVQRFLHERQILARLHHPNIAALMDGGTTPDGLPYFVMERVHGVAIHRYCDQHRLSIRQRLELFLKVCDAVQFAHRNLVVHRDLKPGNILVSEEGEPKLLDFGIAKLLESDQSPLTSAGMRPMTPEYASPEQILGHPITTASDVYSLGGLLYELLSGRHPFPPGERKGPSLLQWVCHGETEPLSRVLDRSGEKIDADAVSAARSTEPRPLRRRLSGDLDAIVLKALAKDPQRRYGSVQALAEDIRRHLTGRPVEARQWTFGYQVGKFFRMHWRVVTAPILLLVIAGTGLVSWNLAATAKTEQQKRTALETFLTDFFEQPTVDPEGENLTVRTILDRAGGNMGESLADQPEIQAMLMNMMGYAYLQLKLPDQAEPLLEDSVRIRRETPGIPRGDRIPSLINLATLRKRKGDLGDAKKLLLEAFDLSEEEGEYHVRILRNLGGVYESLGEYANAESMYQDALKIQAKRNLEDDEETAWIRNNLAFTLKQLEDRIPDAEALYRENLEPHRRSNPQLQRPVAASLLNLADLVSNRDTDQAEELLRESIRLYKQAYGDGPRAANALYSLAILLHDQGRLAEAKVFYQDALAIYEDQYAQSQVAANVLRNLASLQLDQGAVDSAEASILRALEIYRSNKSAANWRIAVSESILGGCYLAQGQSDKAAPLLEQSYRRLLADEGEDSPRTRAAQERWEKLREQQEKM